LGVVALMLTTDSPAAFAAAFATCRGRGWPEQEAGRDSSTSNRRDRIAYGGGFERWGGSAWMGRVNGVFMFCVGKGSPPRRRHGRGYIAPVSGPVLHSVTHSGENTMRGPTASSTGKSLEDPALPRRAAAGRCSGATFSSPARIGTSGLSDGGTVSVCTGVGRETRRRVRDIKDAAGRAERGK